MNKAQQLQELINGRTADLATIRRQREKASEAQDVALRRELRRQEADAEGDIQELSAEIAKIECWQKSPERFGELALASREAATAERKYAEAEALWREFSVLQKKQKAIGEQLVRVHAEIDQHARNAMAATFSRDMALCMEQVSMVVPLARGNSGALSHAVAAALREVMMAVPGGKLAQEQYLIPNAWTNWTEPASIEGAVAATRRDFTMRMIDIKRAVKA